MTGLYIFAGIIIVGIVALMVLRTKWGRARGMEVKLREANIEKERNEEAARKATREGK